MCDRRESCARAEPDGPDPVKPRAGPRVRTPRSLTCGRTQANPNVLSCPSTTPYPCESLRDPLLKFPLCRVFGFLFIRRLNHPIKPLSQRLSYCTPVRFFWCESSLFSVGGFRYIFAKDEFSWIVLMFLTHRQARSSQNLEC